MVETDEQRAEKLADKFMILTACEPSLFLEAQMRVAVMNAQRLAREDEREQCVELCDAEEVEYSTSARRLDMAGAYDGATHDTCSAMACKRLAAAIRSRQPGGAK